MGSNTYRGYRNLLSLFKGAIFTVLTLLVFIRGSARAYDWVTTVSTMAALQDALYNTACLSGDTLTVEITPNTYVAAPMSQEAMLVVATNCDTVTLNGSGRDNTVIGGNGQYRVIDVLHANILTINNITIPHTRIYGENSGSLIFWGFTDLEDTYRSISFTTSNGSDLSGFDDMIVAEAVPEPSTLALCGLAGIAFLGCRWRRRLRRKTA